MAALLMRTAPAGESARLLQRMRKLVREARGDNRAGGGAWLHAQRRELEGLRYELEGLRYELEASVKRELTAHRGGAETDEEHSHDHA
jgi:hypothetical protein